MNKLKITRYSDSGHSWFKLPRKLLTQLGIEEKISSCSYQLGEFVYLEEDCDIAIFFKAYLKTDDLSWEKMTQVADITTKYSDKSSKIRTYSNYVAGFKPVKWDLNLNVRLFGKNYTTSEVNGQKVLVNENGQRFKLGKMQIGELELV